MQVKDAKVLVTGANRGIGRALVKAALDRGAAKVYAAARNTDALSDVVALDPQRVQAVKLDITNKTHVTAAAKEASDVTLLINNAGVASFGPLLDASEDELRLDMEVNYFSTAAMARTFVPLIEANGGGGIVNLNSVVSLANMPMVGGYSVSKTASHSLTQSLRGLLADRGISVHGVYPGPVDTDMAKGIEMDKATPEDVADEILDGIEAGAEDIFPDPMAKGVQEAYFKDPKGVEKEFAGYK